MKIEYICHACLSIDTGDLRILTDPWFRGPAYCGQWNVFPKPVDLHAVADTQVLLLSHGHEDRFHSRSLEIVPKTARVLYPYTWYGGVTHYLKELGFEDVAEAATHKTFHLTPHTAVTYLVNSLDSIMVIESHDKVFVNVNDALHAYPTPIIDVFTAYIRHRWPRIDTVFCGFGGASYFPNTVHCDGKNDLEIAEAREQMFVHAFCRIVHRLKPAVAVPFAADFALLRPRQRWINEARFPRARIADYYRIVYGDSPGNPQIHAMYPGDVLFDNALQPTSPYRQQLHSGNLLHLIDKQYGEEIAALETQACISEFEIEDLERALLRNLLLRARLFSPEVLRRIEFTVRVSDIRERPFFNISLRSGEPRVDRGATRAPDSILEIEARSDMLQYSFSSDWGGDAITIGYGCEIEVFEQEAVKTNLDVICVQLLTRFPIASQQWRKEPVRLARYLLSSPFNRNLGARAAWNRVRGKPSPGNTASDKMREWLFRTKCDVCRACDLPLLNSRFAETLPRSTELSA